MAEVFVRDGILAFPQDAVQNAFRVLGADGGHGVVGFLVDIGQNEAVGGWLSLAVFVALLKGNACVGAQVRVAGAVHIHGGGEGAQPRFIGADQRLDTAIFRLRRRKPGVKQHRHARFGGHFVVGGLQRFRVYGHPVDTLGVKVGRCCQRPAEDLVGKTCIQRPNAVGEGRPCAHQSPSARAAQHSAVLDQQHLFPGAACADGGGAACGATAHHDDVIFPAKGDLAG